VPTPVASNRVPNPNTGAPAKHHFPLPNAPRSGAGGTPVANNRAPSPNVGAPAKHHFPLPKAGARAHGD
jgi:hypothetical protein